MNEIWLVVHFDNVIDEWVGPFETIQTAIAFRDEHIPWATFNGEQPPKDAFKFTPQETKDYLSSRY